MRGIELLHPELQVIANKFLAECKNRGLNVLITETWRTKAEQDALYAQGRTAPGKIVTNCQGDTYQSAHQWGMAFDFCRNIKGQEYDDSDGFFAKVGGIGKSLGLAWGGDWKSPDKPHLELAKYMPNNSTATLKKQYITPERFKASWGLVPVLTATITRPTIKIGSTGEHVKYLQAMLNKMNPSPELKADGDFGMLTDGAVRVFQASNGLVTDGIVGPATWLKIG